MTSLSPARRAAVGRISPVRIGVFSLLLFALICVEFYIGETALTVFYDQLLGDFSYTENKGWQKIAAWFIKELRFWLPFLTVCIFQYVTYRGYHAENGVCHKEMAWQVGIVTVLTYGGLLPYVAVLSKDLQALAISNGEELATNAGGVETTLMLHASIWFVRLAVPLLMLLVYHAARGRREAATKVAPVEEAVA